MKLNWVEDKSTLDTSADAQGVEQVVHSASIEEASEAGLKVAVIDSIDKANSLLSDNIGDDSRYLLCEWDVNNSTLTVVVTDDDKKNDSRQVVKCTMSSHAKNMKALEISSKDEWEVKTQEVADFVRESIHNYLTTCREFMLFSLIAIFHCESRDKTRLL
jgi:hypothetical protein